MRRAVIVGASSGLGFEVAKILLDDGWSLGVAARRQALLQELVDMCPDRVVAQAVDVGSADAADCLLELVGKLGGMDLYLHSAGIGWQNAALDADKELNLFMCILSKIVLVIRLIRDIFLQLFTKKTK